MASKKAVAPTLNVRQRREWAQRFVLGVVDATLIAGVALIVAARGQMNEALSIRWDVLPTELSTFAGPEEPTMLLFAGCIWTIIVFRTLLALMLGRLSWRPTSLLAPLGLLVAAAIVSISAASNRHVAIVEAMNLLSPLGLALLLVQITDARWKRRLLLLALAANGVTLAYRCIEQYHWDSREVLELAQENPEAMLLQQGLESGTFAARQYLDRVKSRDIAGFFAISNTAASYLILTLAATAALMWQRLRTVEAKSRSSLAVIFTVFLGAQAYALWLTNSKGGIGAAAAATILALVLIWQRKWLVQRRRLIFFSCCALAVLGIAAVIGHGLYHGRLPTASMWVRWQYWEATGRMIAEHGLTGVGPGNFGRYYTMYMDPLAPEVVQNPHNIFLSLFSEWGILGLLGFLWLILAVTWRAGVHTRTLSGIEQPEKRLQLAWLGIPLAVGLIWIRWANTGLGDADENQQRAYFVVAILAPAAIWLTTWFFATRTGKDAPASEDSPRWDSTSLFLGCGLLGFLLHNSIDFALLQPGVATAFFVVVAVLISNVSEPAKILNAVKPRSRAVRLFAGCGVLILLSGILFVVFLKVHTHDVLRTAQQKANALYFTMMSRPVNTEEGRRFIEQEVEQGWYLVRGAMCDRTDPDPTDYQSRLCHFLWQNVPVKMPESLSMAIGYAEAARYRDPANYRYDRRLSDLHLVAADAEPQEASWHLDQALDYAQQAQNRYPGSTELMIHIGRILERQGRPAVALEQYEAALDREDAFVKRLHDMFPHWDEYVGRLGSSSRRETERRMAVIRKALDQGS